MYFFLMYLWLYLSMKCKILSNKKTLISSFSSVTIRNVESQSYRIWRYQRFLIVFEYADKPLLPPPVNSIYYLFVGIRYLVNKIHDCRERRRHGI